jgi:hypothetical protein
MFHGVEPVELCKRIPDAELWREEIRNDSVVTEVTETVGVALEDLVEMGDSRKDGSLNWYDVVE